MGPVRISPALRAAAVAAAAVGAVAVLSACSAKPSSNPDLVAGKQLFVQRCGACHQLGRADTRGTVGPNLDEAFRRSVQDGMDRSGIRGAVRGWILEPNPEGAMPAKLVTGREADNVAAYVAEVVAKGGKDTGLLATAVKKAGGGEPAVARNGVLQIDADPSGQLTFVTNRATAPPGRLTVRAVNRSGVPHDIVIDGKGRGRVVRNGGVSEFTAEFAPGTYAYYCSVPGHREAGMEGTLTVK